MELPQGDVNKTTISINKLVITQFDIEWHFQRDVNKLTIIINTLEITKLDIKWHFARGKNAHKLIIARNWFCLMHL